MSLTKDQLLQSKPKIAPVELENGTLYVRKISGSDFDWVREGKQSELSMMARLVVVGVVDSEGTRLFKNSELSQAQSLEFETLLKIATAIQEHNGMTAKNAELVGNSDATTS